MKYILFVCGHNAGRSQMSQGFFNHDKAGCPKVDVCYEAISAGTRPGEKINPQVVQVMGELGIDLTNPKIYYPKGLDSNYVNQRRGSINRVVVACGDDCILPPGMNVKLERWNLSDPHGQALNKVREIRDLTRKKVKDLLKELTQEVDK